MSGQSPPATPPPKQLDPQDLEAAGIKRMWARLIFEDGIPAVELIIETTVETRPDAPGFERRKIDQIVETALRLDTNGNYDRIVVEPCRS